MKEIRINIQQAPRSYPIRIGSPLLRNTGLWARKVLGANLAQVSVVSNQKVYGLYGGIVEKSLREAGFEVFVRLTGDGEEYKNLRSLADLIDFFSRRGMTRNSAVIALGGGVVGDLAGFAAAVYLRGIPVLQIPTTLLAMIDSSVGGKTAVNSRYGKNLIGSFYQPAGVLIDIDTLRTLDQRELTAGFCEAVKQGAVAGGGGLFKKTSGYLEKYPVKKIQDLFDQQNFLRDTTGFLSDHISFKASVVVLDEKEDLTKTDIRSRKILNFGHTLAHALEKVTDYRYFKHGEAVGLGILFAARISNLLDFLDLNSLKSLNDVVHRAGDLPGTDKIDTDEVLRAFKYDKKNIGSSLQWVLLKGIGKPIIYQGEKIPTAVLEQGLADVLHQRPDR